MASGDTSGTRPERDLKALSDYLYEARSFHSDFVRQVPAGVSKSKFFHYTDLNGLHSIITTHDLRLTHARYCNDEAEMRLGVEVARNQIQLLQNNPSTNPLMKDYLETLDDLLAKPLSQSVYICCFCEEIDNNNNNNNEDDERGRLSQWRAYGGNGSGVSIMFDLSKFDDIAGGFPNSDLLAVWNVIYAKVHQEQIMYRVITETYTKFGADITLTTADIANKAKDIIDFFVPTFKHVGFEEENEWRMIFAPSPSTDLKPEYRAAHNMLIPFYSLMALMVNRKNESKESWQLPIEQITVGPSRHRELNRASVQSLLADNGYPNVKVTVADIPYRD